VKLNSKNSAQKALKVATRKIEKFSGEGHHSINIVGLWW